MVVQAEFSVGLDVGGTVGEMVGNLVGVSVAELVGATVGKLVNAGPPEVGAGVPAGVALFDEKKHRCVVLRRSVLTNVCGHVTVWPCEAKTKLMVRLDWSWKSI